MVSCSHLTLVYRRPMGTISASTKTFGLFSHVFNTSLMKISVSEAQDLVILTARIFHESTSTPAGQISVLELIVFVQSSPSHDVYEVAVRGNPCPMIPLPNRLV